MLRYLCHVPNQIWLAAHHRWGPADFDDISEDRALFDIGSLLLKWVLWPQAVAYILSTLAEINVFADKILVNHVVLDNVIGNIVEHCEVRLRREHNRQIGKFKSAVLVGGQHGDFYMRVAQATVSDARPQDGVHLRHI